MPFALPPVVTHEQADEVASRACSLLTAADSVVDASALIRFDSSVVAVLLAIDRHLRRQGGRVDVIQAPQRLRGLLQVYALDEILPLAVH